MRSPRRAQAAVAEVRTKGLAGRGDVPRLRVYASEQAHSSIDKAVIAIGLGHESLRKIPVDADFRMRVDALADAVAEDRRAGVLPIAVVATVGTTSTTSVDPVPAIADICEREQLWLHVDAAYAGVAAMLPSHAHILDGADRADSLVVNPHKWLFTPFDLSAFYCRRMDVIRAAFALTPEYLKTSEEERVQQPDGHRRAARPAIPRAQAVDGSAFLRRARHPRTAERAHAAGGGSRLVDRRASRLRAHGAGAVQRRLFSVAACRRVRCRMRNWTQPTSGSMDAVNATGEVFLSHTRLHDRVSLRIAIGHIDTSERHVRRAWELLQEHAAS